MSRSTISTFQLFAAFPDEETARQYLESRLWADGVKCPECKRTERITALHALGVGNVPDFYLPLCDGEKQMKKPCQSCQCEHDRHFPPFGTGHPYGEKRPDVKPVKTPFGTFNVCLPCSEICLSIYRGQA